MTYNLLTDIKGVGVGHAQCLFRRTGVTFILFDMPFTASVHVYGGGPGTRETDALAPHRLVDHIDALVFSGGSVYGLAAADRVTALLGQAGRGYGLTDQASLPKSPIVPAAVLYDLANGGDKDWKDVPPYGDLAEQAYHAVGRQFALGCHGAGTGAMAGRLKGGVGSVSFQMKDGLCVAALSCVNSFGSVVHPRGFFWARPFEQNREYGGYDGADMDVSNACLDLEDVSGSKPILQPRENTTLSLVVTNAALTSTELKQVSVMAGNGFARAIRPVFTPFDGDVVFAASSGEKPLKGDRALWITRLGMLAADCVARSIARAVYEAESMWGHMSWKDIFGR